MCTDVKGAINMLFMIRKTPIVRGQTTSVLYPIIQKVPAGFVY